MDLKQLRYFVAVAEELHFGRAATRLFISQPALSFDIKKLESQLDVQLLSRNNKSVSLTNAGQVLLDEARYLLLRAEQARRLTLRSAQGFVGRLSIGFVNSILHRGLPQAVKTFEQDHPDTEIVLMEMNSAEQAQALQRGQIDIGFVHWSHFPESIRGEPVLAEPFLCCLPQGHRLADKARIDLAQLANDDFILFPRNVSPHYHDLIIARCVAAGFSPRIRHETRLWQTVVAMVAYEMGVALVPQTLAGTWKEGVHYCEISGDGALSEVHAIRHADNPSAAAESFLTVLKALQKPVAPGL
ncbi:MULTISPECIES: LysR family transcriptional regulator [Pseudomonas]|uniref:LysR family transcriptional regulator n=1 Tax=Pseudomonas TaxID=286 RepID=UPI0006A607AA|nr:MULTISPECIES: LysR family transcriptional regulator [Pseudomonas]AUF99847.1 LysR family transcriptional regulator [Pseudomonas sp. 09C 129]AZC99605.1 Transcriptional regulator, LysR family [Pseudomonas chlororaphis subsp. chlororaphis]MBM0282315.1 LysR family transcriptional regulator [Pseudomonas chlororaphis]MDO1506251.1 LysR family transcriptional regulator [Pseudomonas chlororaphis]ORM48287.1 LysR family transcriptional regulator [Pseudomonas chlororaphis subsp. chlororaphis]